MHPLLDTALTAALAMFLVIGTAVATRSFNYAVCLVRRSDGGNPKA